MENNSFFSFLVLPFQPASFACTAAAEKAGFLRALFFSIVSGLFTVTAVFIAGGSVYNIFFEQYTTFILERLTGFALTGKMISRFDYTAVFCTGLIFWIKFVLFFFFLFALLLKGSVRIQGKNKAYGRFEVGALLTISATALASYGLWTILLSVVVRLAGTVVPAYTSWIFYLAFSAVFCIFLPVTMQKMFEDLEPETCFSPFPFYLSFYSAAFIVLVLWTFNHYNFSLLRMI